MQKLYSSMSFYNAKEEFLRMFLIFYQWLKVDNVICKGNPISLASSKSRLARVQGPNRTDCLIIRLPNLYQALAELCTFVLTPFYRVTDKR